jgi:enolase
MGIGLEGGLAPFISKAGHDQVPEQRAWRMAVQAIKESGYVPGKDIVIAYDHAASELSNAYRDEFKQTDSVGMYYFWRSEEKVTMSRDQLIELYKQSIENIPAVSFEDSFAEDDFEGWRLLMEEMGDKVFVIGDDLVTTKDTVIEESADRKLINTALIKANQIGTLSETMLAILVALGKGLEIVVSHRSKSPNDDMEAQIALSANALGLKTGGGANTERLFKYGAVTKIMKDMEKMISGKFTDVDVAPVTQAMQDLVITDIIAYEEPTNAGIPTVGVEVYAGVAGNKQYRKILKFTGSTPLGTSAGTGEAIHLVDSIIEHSEVVDRHRDMFQEQPDKTFMFKKEMTAELIGKTNDSELTSLWQRTQRYKGKGCQSAVNNVLEKIAPVFVGHKVSEFGSILAVDQALLLLEKKQAVIRKKLSENAEHDAVIDSMQRKANLGMNAILSVSLAVSRLIAHVRGKDLWQLLREEMEQAMAKVILDSGDKKVLAECLPDAVLKKVQADKSAGWQTLARSARFEDLVACLQKVTKQLEAKKATLYQALRKHMPIYGA